MTCKLLIAKQVLYAKKDFLVMSFFSNFTVEPKAGFQTFFSPTCARLSVCGDDQKSGLARESEDKQGHARASQGKRGRVRESGGERGQARASKGKQGQARESEGKQRKVRASEGE